jgi:hypothetical protein
LRNQHPFCPVSFPFKQIPSRCFREHLAAFFVLSSLREMRKTTAVLPACSRLARGIGYFERFTIFFSRFRPYLGTGCESSSPHFFTYREVITI